MFKAKTIIFYFSFSLFLILAFTFPKSTVAQQGLGECCGPDYGTCDNPLTCDPNALLPGDACESYRNNGNGSCIIPACHTVVCRGDDTICQQSPLNCGNCNGYFCSNPAPVPCNQQLNPDCLTNGCICNGCAVGDSCEDPIPTATPTPNNTSICCSNVNDCASPSTSRCVNRTEYGIPVNCSASMPNYCIAATASNPSFRLPRYSDLTNLGNFHFDNSNPFVIGAILSALLPYIFGFAGLLLFAYLLYGGFHLITSFGSPKAVYEAWLIIFRALSGFIVIFASFWIIRIIEIIFNITII